MRFVRVTFRCFGPFEEQSLDLSGPGGLHVVFGPNEAGKSSALRGLDAFLFGFPPQSRDDFRFKYSQFRVRRVLQDSSGQTLECVRRKGNIATLRMIDERTEIPESSLSRIIGGLERRQFEQLFGLDSKRLVDGGREIAEGRGELGEALFAAAAGLAGLRALGRVARKTTGFALQVSGTKPTHQQGPERIRSAARHHSRKSLPPETYAAAASASSRGSRKGGGILRRERRSPFPARRVSQRYRAPSRRSICIQRARHRLENSR